MDHRRLGRTPFELTPLGFGAVKIGRNVGIKYPRPYDLPGDEDTRALLNAVLDLGINYIDTAPAYGLSEQRIGAFLSHRNSEFICSTKVGERFENGQSTHDFSESAVRASIQRSRRLLKRQTLDIVFVHSDGRDEHIMRDTAVVPTLQQLKSDGVITAIGFSGKTVDGARAALMWADAIMVEYHIEDQSHGPVIDEACDAGVGVIVKKGLASGRLGAAEAVRFVLANPNVTALVVGGLNIDHLRANLAAAQSVSHAHE